MIDYIVAVLIAAPLVLAGIYLVKSRHKPCRCIGCPANCGNHNACSCHK